MTDRYADLILVADQVHTMSAQVGATAVAVRDGVIVAVGAESDLAGFIGPGTRSLRYPGATIVPGLSDAHAHPLSGAGFTVGMDLRGVTSLTELRQQLTEALAELQAGDWLRGWGLNPNVWGLERVTSALLDEVTGTVPALLRFFDAHSALANQPALRAAGIAGPRTFPTGSRVDVDADGTPTGLLLEADAMQLVFDVMPPEPIEDLAHRVTRLLDDMAASGLTSSQVMDFIDEPFELLRLIEAEGELALRLRFSPWVEPKHTRDDWAHFLEWQGTGGRRWKVHGVKFFLDGTIDGGTAWLDAPDTHGESIHSVWSDPADYAAAVRFFDENGVGTATHAIGDAAIRHALATISQLPAASAGGAVHRIEHAETLPDELVDVFPASGAVASMQPTHCTHFVRSDHTDNWSERLGPERAQRAWRTRSLAKAGVNLALGSDWPVADFEPLAIMADAQLRRDVALPDLDPVGPEEALTALQALEAYTMGSAIAAGVADTEGSISVGKVADLTILAADPLAISPEHLAATAVLATVVSGEIQFAATG
ncbi:MAG: amidohydrolase [Pseudolysinimonas sp.]|uniref:amidohydrolase n=1 Tax=Pseudolysinimonas sp. TaxID=2680009 RepID=UPI003263D70A